MWDDEQENWQRLKSILACGAKGASILVTTRLEKVADMSHPIHKHHMTGLLEEDLGIVEFTNLVKINSILVALCVDYKRCAC